MRINARFMLPAMLAAPLIMAACGADDVDGTDATSGIRETTDADEDPAPAGAADASAEPVSVLMNWLPQAEQGGYWQAMADDLGAAHGLEIDVLSGGPGVQTIANVAVGEADYGLVGSDVILEARSQGIPVVMVLGGFESPQCLMAHPEAGISGIDSLHDAQISVTPSGTFWRWIAAEFGYTEIEVVPPVDLGVFFDSPGMVRQCFLTSEPYVAEQEGIDLDYFLVSDAGYQPYTSGLFTTEERIRERPDEVAAVVATMLDGWERFLADNSAGAEAIMAANPDMTRDHIDNTTGMLRDDLYTEVGVMDPQRWSRLHSQLEDAGVLAAEVDPFDGFTTEFVDQHRQQP